MSRVLVVNRLLISGFIYRDVLESGGHSAVLSLSGEEAYRKIHNEPFDVVVIDDAITDMEPSDLLWKMREIYPSLKGIICTMTNPGPLGDPYAWDGIFIKTSEFTILLREIEAVCKMFSGSIATALP